MATHMSNTTSPAPPVYDNPFVRGGGDPGADATWIILSAFIVFTMQSGFGLFESGMVSRKSESSVTTKNMMDACIGGLAFWFLGFGFAFGGPKSNSTGKFAGLEYFGWENLDLELQGHIYAKYIFHMAFATTSTTIVAGAFAERIKLKAYMLFTLINCGVVYPFPVHWMWHPAGWLSKLGAYDFAGSGIVHMSAGAASMAGILILGPRHKRFGKDKKLYHMANPTNVVFGAFCVWWGFIGLTCGSTFGMSGSLWKIASRVSMVTMLGGIAGGVSAVMLSFVMELTVRHYLLDIPQITSGVIGGLVAITAGASVIELWHGVIIGFIGGWIANGGAMLLEKLHIDDPVGAVGRHWFAGFWGLIAAGLFAKVDDIASLASENGAFRGGHGHLLGCQIAAGLAITVWSGGLTAIQLLVMKYTFGIRLSLEDELKGSDYVEHDIVDELMEYKMQLAQQYGVGRAGSIAEVNGFRLGKENPVFTIESTVNTPTPVPKFAKGAV